MGCLREVLGSVESAQRQAAARHAAAAAGARGTRSRQASGHHLVNLRMRRLVVLRLVLEIKGPRISVGHRLVLLQQAAQAGRRQLGSAEPMAGGGGCCAEAQAVGCLGRRSSREEQQQRNSRGERQSAHHYLDNQRLVQAGVRKHLHGNWVAACIQPAPCKRCSSFRKRCQYCQYWCDTHLLMVGHRPKVADVCEAGREGELGGAAVELPQLGRVVDHRKGEPGAAAMWEVERQRQGGGRDDGGGGSGRGSGMELDGRALSCCAPAGMFGSPRTLRAACSCTGEQVVSELFARSAPGPSSQPEMRGKQRITSAAS